MKTGTLKNKTLKLVVKWYGQPDELHFADPGTGVTWNGKEGNPEHYGGRRKAPGDAARPGVLLV